MWKSCIPASPAEKQSANSSIRSLRECSCLAARSRPSPIQGLGILMCLRFGQVSCCASEATVAMLLGDVERGEGACDADQDAESKCLSLHLAMKSMKHSALQHACSAVD